MKMTDYMLPFTWDTLPQGFDDNSARHAFLEKQDHVLTNARDLEVENAFHVHIHGDADRHFYGMSKLGHGGSG